MLGHKTGRCGRARDADFNGRTSRVLQLAGPAVWRRGLDGRMALAGLASLAQGSAHDFARDSVSALDSGDL